MVRRRKQRWLLGHRRLRFLLRWVGVGPRSRQRPGEEATPTPQSRAEGFQPGGRRGWAGGSGQSKVKPPVALGGDSDRSCGASPSQG